jgi:hypothetical protein
MPIYYLDFLETDKVNSAALIKYKLQNLSFLRLLTNVHRAIELFTVWKNLFKSKNYLRKIMILID